MTRRAELGGHGGGFESAEGSIGRKKKRLSRRISTGPIGPCRDRLRGAVHHPNQCHEHHLPTRSLLGTGCSACGGSMCHRPYRCAAAWTEPNGSEPFGFARLHGKNQLPVKSICVQGGIFQLQPCQSRRRGWNSPNAGCCLEVVPHGKTRCGPTAFCLAPEPSPLAATCGDADAERVFAAMIEMADAGQGTRYSATADACRRGGVQSMRPSALQRSGLG